MSGDSDPRELSLAHLEHERAPGWHGKALVRAALAVDADAALLDHPQRLGSTRGEPRLLEELRDADRLAACGHLDSRDILGDGALAVARVEILQYPLGGSAVVEARHDLLREA